jgi:NitT/TauT family transport system substrate-binding protein
MTRKARTFETLALAALIGLSVQGAVRAQNAPEKVTMGILYILADAGTFVAQESGYFKKEGLDVELQRFRSGGDMVAILATGNLDVGSGGSTPGLFNAYARGIDVPIVASRAVIAPEDAGGNMLVVRKDLIDSGRVKSVSDLKGMKIAVVNIQSTSLNYVLRGIAKGGLKRDDVELVEMPFDQFIPAIKNKAVDAVMVYSPLGNVMADQMKLGMAMPEASPARTAAGDTANLMFYSPKFAASEAGKRFMVANLKGTRDYQRAFFGDGQNRAAVCEMIRRHLPYVPESCAGIAMSSVDANGEVNVKSLERYQDEWVQWGMMRKPVDIRSHIDMRPLDYALKIEGRRDK